MSRVPVIVANWKMYKTAEEARLFIRALAEPIATIQRRVFIAPSFTALAASVEAAHGSRIQIGAQTMHDQIEGAFTGEVSVRMLKSVPVSFVIVGHSERRAYAGETDLVVNRKLRLALQEQLQPILCVGESVEERERRQHKYALRQQLQHCLQRLSTEQLSQLMIAYEPVWAIGTGRTATPQIAQDAHAFIRSQIEEMFGADSAKEVCLLYGGSVKPDNAAALMAQTDIDGLLVGGASLDVHSFLNIVNY